jgi:hypothetical protein
VLACPLWAGDFYAWIPTSCSRTFSPDLGIEAEHIDFTSRRPVAMEADQFRSLLERDGWQLMIDGPTQEIRGGYLLEAQRGAEQARVLLQPGQRVGAATSIIVVWRKS